MLIASTPSSALRRLQMNRSIRITASTRLLGCLAMIALGSGCASPNNPVSHPARPLARRSIRPLAGHAHRGARHCPAARRPSLATLRKKHPSRKGQVRRPRQYTGRRFQGAGRSSRMVAPGRGEYGHSLQMGRLRRSRVIRRQHRQRFGGRRRLFAGKAAPGQCGRQRPSRGSRLLGLCVALH